MEIITINGTEYRLELKARMIETLEMSLKSKKSLLDIFMPVDIKPAASKKKDDVQVGGLKYCAIGDMLRIFWAELQVNNTPNHTIAFEEACDLYDAYMESEEGQKEGAIGFYFRLGKAAHFFTTATTEE